MGRAAERTLLGQRATVLLPPSKVKVLQGPPQSQLNLEWAYGYNGQAVNAVHWISEEEFVFSLAAVCVVQRLQPAKQRIFVGHSERVTCLSYCPALKLCASGQQDPKGGAGPFICIWRPADCILLSCLVFPLHEEQISAICFNPDGSKLFSLGRDAANTLAVWENFVPGKAGFPVALDLPLVYRQPVAQVATGRVSAFGMVSNSSADFRVAVFDAGRSMVGLMLKFFTVVESQDLRELVPRSAIFPLEHAPRHVLNCCWVELETGRSLCVACGDNGFVFLFEGNASTAFLRVSRSPVGAAVAGAQLLLGSQDSVLHYVKLPKLPGQKMELVSSVPFSQLKGAAVLPGRMKFTVAVSGPAGTLLGTENHRLILLDSQERVRLLHASHEGDLGALALHPSLELLASGSTDATVRFWDVREHQPVAGRILDFQIQSWPGLELPRHVSVLGSQVLGFPGHLGNFCMDLWQSHGALRGIFSLAFSPAGHVLAVGFGSGHCQLCDVPELTARSSFRCSQERLSALHFVGDEMLAVGSWDQMVYLVSVSNPKSPLKILRGNTSSVTQLQISSDHRFLMTNSKDGQVLFFSVASGERVTQETTKDETWQDWNCPCAWHTTGMWASNPHFGFAGIKSCRAFQASTGEEILVAGDISHQVKLYHFPAMPGQGFHTYDGHASFVSCMVTIPCKGKQTHVLTADDRAILQWRVSTTAPASSRAWREERQEHRSPMRLKEPARQKPRERAPWEHEPHKESKARGTVPGPWVQHGGSQLPYAEHLAETPRRGVKKAARSSPAEPLERARGAKDGRDAVAGARGKDQTSLKHLGLA